METITRITVDRGHCDELGHLNHVEAVRYLETAREDWYARCGLYGDSGVFGATGYGPVVVNIDYSYRGECFLGEALEVWTRPVRKGRKSFVLAHEIVKPDGSVAIDGEAVTVIMDTGSRAIVPVPDCLARHLPGSGER